MNHILVVAGEASGDHHASRVLAALRARDAKLNFWGAGGVEMRRQGVELLSDVRDLAAIGPVAALSKFRNYWRLYQNILNRARRERPRVALLVDFPEFNLRLARRLKQIGVPVVYFISPQLWAWRKRRIQTVRQSVERMVVIFPFEESFYRAQGVEATFVGHPFGQLRPSRSRDQLGLGAGPWVCLMPGSRSAEVERILPPMLEALELLSQTRDVRAMIVRAASIDAELIQRFLAGHARLRDRIRIVEGEALDYLAASDFAFVKSGTSTLQATLAGVPFVAVYRVSIWSWMIGKLLIDTPHYCISNLIAGRGIVPELMQWDATPGKMAEAARRYLDDPVEAAEMRRQLKEVANELGGADAYERTAGIVQDVVNDGSQLAASS